MGEGEGDGSQKGRLTEIPPGRATVQPRGQRDEQGCEEVAKGCCSSSRPTTFQTRPDWQLETVEMVVTPMGGEACL